MEEKPCLEGDKHMEQREKRPTPVLQIKVSTKIMNPCEAKELLKEKYDNTMELSLSRKCKGINIMSVWRT
jgi:hypothetical protein